MQQRLHLEALLLSRTAELARSRDVAQAASQAKSMFLANMSHEIRTPMNAILGLSYLALATPLADETRNYIQKVHNAAENLLGIINGILDFSPETRLTNASFITKSSRFSANAGCRQGPGMLSRNKTFRIAKQLPAQRFFANACPGHGVGMLMRSKINKRILHNHK